MESGDITMTHEEREKWVATLQPGNEVAVQYGYRSPWSILTVEKITPTGKLRLSNDALTDKSGHVRKSDHGYHIEPLTDGIRNKMLRVTLVEETRLWTSRYIEFLTTEELQQIHQFFMTAKTRYEDKPKVK